MDKKNYTLSEVIDFVTNGEDSSNVDIVEKEEIVILPPIEKAEVETDCDNDISDDNTKDLHIIFLAVCWQPLVHNTVKQNLDKNDQTSDNDSYKQRSKRQEQNK